MTPGCSVVDRRHAVAVLGKARGMSDAQVPTSKRPGPRDSGDDHADLVAADRARVSSHLEPFELVIVLVATT